MHRVLAILVLWGVFAAAMPVIAQSVPSSINYQGKLTDAAGQPVADGDHAVQFKLYTVQSGSGTPVWTSSATSVTTKGGIFTTALSPSTSVFSNTNLYLETIVEGQTLQPRIKLDSVPFAMRAGTADTVPDGSVGAAKLGSDVAFTQALYKSGVKSGLPSTCTFTIMIDGHEVDPPATLAAPYRESLIAVKVIVAPGSWRIHRLGGFEKTPVVLRRKLTDNHAWYDWCQASANGTELRRDVRFILRDGDVTLCTWEILDGVVSRYNLRLADDGLPVEEITLLFDLIMTRTPGKTKEMRTIGAGVQAGFTSGHPASAEYRVIFDNTTFREISVASDGGFHVDAAQPNPGGDIFPSWELANPEADGFKLRQNPLGRPNLYSWFRDIVTEGDLLYKTVTLELSTEPRLRPLGLLQAWPSSYTLRLADDGLPIEEFDLVYDTPRLP